MSKKPTSISELLKATIAILGGVASILTILQFFGIVNLPEPIVEFFTRQISLGISFLLMAATALLTYLLLDAWEDKPQGKSILDYSMGRKLARTCQQPITTESLKERYLYYRKQRRLWFPRRYNFNDYLKDLEMQGYLSYERNLWRVTDKALEYITKYHGR
ncbi:MAG: hypothetical protein ACQCN4_09800 [Candidatus Bathyarchaeia archaeon]|jgi:hypothetical protein